MGASRNSSDAGAVALLAALVLGCSGADDPAGSSGTGSSTASDAGSSASEGSASASSTSGSASGSGSAVTTDATNNTTDNCTGGAPSPPPACDGNGCQSSCGCDGCGPGERACVLLGDYPFTSMLQCGEGGDCQDEIPCADGHTCILLQNLSGACSDALDCDGVQTFYDALVGLDDGCQTDDQCRLLTGQCSVGLGDCYHAVGPYSFNSEFYATQAVLDELGARWADLGCGGPVCDCAAPPASGAVCQDGTCVLGP